MLAYACWNLKRLGFIAALMLALVLLVGGGGFLALSGTTPAPVALLLFVVNVLLVFFSYTAYRECK